MKSIDLPIQVNLYRQVGQDLINSYIENEVRTDSHSDSMYVK